MSRIIRTPEDAQKRFREVELYAHREDHESAHIAEDQFHFDVLESIASGKLRGKACQELAKVAMKTRKLEFQRISS